jgi:hypothetical protein
MLRDGALRPQRGIWRRCARERAELKQEGDRCRSATAGFRLSRPKRSAHLPAAARQPARMAGRQRLTEGGRTEHREEKRSRAGRTRSPADNPLAPRLRDALRAGFGDVAGTALVEGRPGRQGPPVASPVRPGVRSLRRQPLPLPEARRPRLLPPVDGRGSELRWVGRLARKDEPAAGTGAPVGQGPADRLGDKLEIVPMSRLAP